MLAQAGLPATLALFLEVDPPLLALTYAATATHTATAYWDVAYANPRREVSPTEQHAHAFLEVLPMSAAALLTVLHPGQAKELLLGPRVRWGFRRKKRPLSPGYIAGLLATLALGLGVPYAEEILRCTHAGRSAGEPRPPPRGSPLRLRPSWCWRLRNQARGCRRRERTQEIAVETADFFAQRAVAEGHLGLFE